MYLNRVYRQLTSENNFRVIYESIESLWIINIDDINAWPELIEIADLEEQLACNEAIFIDDPITLHMPEQGSIQEIKRDEAITVLRSILSTKLDLFYKNTRNKLIRNAEELSGKRRIYVVRNLRRYWQRGCCPNALVPDYHLSGGKGKPRRNIENKPGRKRTTSDGVGAIVDETVVDIFKLSIDGFFIKNDKLSLTDAYTKAISIFKSQDIFADPTTIPTLRQFKYFYKTNYQKNEVIKKRTTPKIYDKDIRALTSTSTVASFGPGARYEIDATIGDVYLVSQQDPSKIIGRPTIYMVKDVFSRMVVGLYVGLENASWVSAMIAMSNAFLDKVSFCKDYGIDIEASQWPSIGLPESILADKGELYRRQADVLGNIFNIQLSNSRSYRGDDKGGVERYFKTLQTKFKPYVEGVVEPVNGKKRLGKRYELDATLNLREFTRIVLHLVINHNNHQVVEKYDFAEDMPMDLPAIPVQIWNWGIKNRTGRLRPCQEDLVKVNLLPHERGTVSAVGIKFKGMYFTCNKALQLGWFDRIKQTRPKSVEIAFDPRRTDLVYLRPDIDYKEFWICELSDRSRRFAGMSFVDAAGILKASRSTEAIAKQEQNFIAPDTQGAIEEIVANAKNKKTNSETSTKSKMLLGIKENRKHEKELERNKESVNLKPVNTQSKTADIVDLKTANKQKKMSYPSLDQYLDDENE